MCQRPIADQIDGMRQLGVHVEADSGCPPVTVHSEKGLGEFVTEISMLGESSSQYFTAMLHVAPLFP